MPVLTSHLFQVMKESYIPNAEWQYEGGYISTDMLPLCCPLSNFTWVRINLNFTRLRPFYIINLIVPSLLFSVCMILAFLLPTDSGERLGYSLTILLSYTVLLTITTDMLPTTSKQTPVISKNIPLRHTTLTPHSINLHSTSRPIQY